MKQERTQKPSSESVELEKRLRKSALEAAGLIDDLQDEDGLIYPLPENAKIISIIQGYDTRDKTRQKVRCAACRQHQPHYRGFKVELKGGGHARIGFNCGEDHFGEGAWKAAVADYGRRVEHVQYLARVKPALDAIAEITPLVREWLARTKVYGRWISAFRREIPDLFARLQEEGRRRGGQLTKDKRQKMKRVNQEGREEKYLGVETIVVGRIPYPEMFQGASPNHGLNGAIKELGLADAILSNRSDAKSLARAFSHLRVARQHLMDAAEIQGGVLRNLDDGWLSGLCEWANSDSGLTGFYEANGRTIIYQEDSDSGEFSFLLPKAIGKSPLSQILARWP